MLRTAFQACIYELCNSNELLVHNSIDFTKYV